MVGGKGDSRGKLRHACQRHGIRMDFLNMQDAERIKSKKTSKVQGFGGAALPAENVHFGAEYVPFLHDRKIAFIRLEGEAFGGTPLEVELRMCVEEIRPAPPATSSMPCDT
jgi:myo-inositol-1-phosphate synthase